ncbi:MAG: hypothetical protein ACXWXT_16750, partial [Candidatus Binatia bacterium]
VGNCTTEARRTRSKEFLIEKFSELGDLRASAVKTFSQETGKNIKVNPFQSKRKKLMGKSR